VSVGIETIIPDHDLALVGNVGRDPGDELQIIHRLQFRAVLTMTVANFALMFQKQEAVQRQDGPDHVFPDPLGLVEKILSKIAICKEAYDALH
jgi:hypothetical protein